MRKLIKKIQIKAALLNKHFFLGLPFVFTKPAIAIIKFYQKVLSPLFGNHCRFYPSCSSYALECFQIHGFGIGLFLILKRLCKCHPLHPGGVDLVPLKKTSNPHKESIQ